MSQLADKERIERFMGALGAEASKDVRLYFTGGSTAVLLGWRPSTIDIRFFPELDELFRALPKLKEELQVNVELASPPEFILSWPAGRTEASSLHESVRSPFTITTLTRRHWRKSNAVTVKTERTSRD